ncbi:MAG: LysM peptidoglycan-binding domain-containing protein [Anaerolineae bacterium]|nr:LysM peptidoglycan-binding domain-containing protein [Anaerolineae bacterium]
MPAEVIEGLVEFTGDQAMIDLDDMTYAPDTFLETVSDYASAEAVGSALETLLNTFSLGEAWNSYLDEVEENAEERHDQKILDALENDEPVYSASKVQELIDEARAEVRAEAEAEIEKIKAEAEQEVKNAYQDGLNDGLDIAERLTPIEPVEDHYYVQSGDTLWEIAEREYGDGSKWPAIYEENKEIIGNNPNIIHPGQDLVIPPEDTVANFTLTPPPAAPVETDTGPETGLDTGEIEQQFETLKGDIADLQHNHPYNLEGRDVYGDNAALLDRKAALFDQLEALDRDISYHNHDLTPEVYDDFAARYEALDREYQEVGLEVYKNQVEALPPPPQISEVQQHILTENITAIERALESGDTTALPELLDQAWRDYDDIQASRAA